MDTSEVVHATVKTITDNEGLQAISHPLRVAILSALREPLSSADVARLLGQQRQKVNYHLKALEAAGLVGPIESRQKGNFIETRFVAVATSFVISPQVVWSDDRRAETMRAQHSLETLVHAGERLQRHAVELLDRATFADEDIPSASVTAAVTFDGPRARSNFMRDYLAMTKELLERHSAREGETYQVVLAAYPQPEGD